MIEDLMKDGLAKDLQSAENKVTQRVNEICKNILFNTAVYKKDEQGCKGFDRFLEKVGINK